jgi:hypothetical protein
MAPPDRMAPPERCPCRRRMAPPGKPPHRRSAVPGRVRDRRRRLGEAHRRWLDRPRWVILSADQPPGRAWLRRRRSQDRGRRANRVLLVRRLPRRRPARHRLLGQLHRRRLPNPPGLTPDEERVRPKERLPARARSPARALLPDLRPILVGRLCPVGRAFAASKSLHKRLVPRRDHRRPPRPDTIRRAAPDRPGTGRADSLPQAAPGQLARRTRAASPVPARTRFVPVTRRP